MAKSPTNGPRKLSSTEVAALVDGLRNMEDEGGKELANVRPYRFGTDNLAIMGDYYGLRMINERFCRRAREVFLPFLRMHPRISSFPPEVKTFAQYCDELENFVSLTTARVDALRSAQLIMLPPSFVSLLTNAYYGGDIAYLPSHRTEFTTSEYRVIQNVTQGLHRALETAWRDLVPLRLSHPVHEDNLQFATFVDAEEKVVCCTFIIQLPDVDPAMLDLIYPLQALKPLAAQLRSRTQSDHAEDDSHWRDRLTAAVMSVPLNVTAQLARPTVPLSALTAVAAGGIVPVDLAPHPQLMVEGVPYLEAEPGEQAGRAAMRITRRIRS
jgi:flagellar motor switch protein FliM